MVDSERTNKPDTFSHTEIRLTVCLCRTGVVSDEFSVTHGSPLPAVRRSQSRLNPYAGCLETSATVIKQAKRFHWLPFDCIDCSDGSSSKETWAVFLYFSTCHLTLKCRWKNRCGQNTVLMTNTLLVTVISCFAVLYHKQRHSREEMRDHYCESWGAEQLQGEKVTSTSVC